MTEKQRSKSPEVSGPKPIRRLQESLINRIAAGEIIHRPASALKELVENSLDAGATSIRVTVKEGGMKLLQIQDNGCGIRKADLPILAERFTTSKLSTFSDLSSLRTYGFRGEALASISYVAHLSVVTKTKTDSCAWRACYQDGVLVPPKPGQTPDPKPCAGNDGTTITAEDLFYNTPTRLSALRGSSEEYARILDVLTRYAVHNSSVSFVCKKAGSASPDLSTPSNSTTKQAIRLLYGQSIARELLNVSISSDNEDGSQDGAKDSMDTDSGVSLGEGKWKGEALFTSANYHSKKMVFLLFINHRLVESSRIKRAIDSIYSAILPKGTSPFVYLSLEIDPRAVDVNVHPTKREVHFLDEENIIGRVADAIQEQLAGQSRSRVFEYQTQTLLTGGTLDVEADKIDKGNKGKGKAAPEEQEGDEDDSYTPSAFKRDMQEPKKVYSKDKVRTSQTDRTLDSMFPVVGLSAQPQMDRDRDKYRNGKDNDGKEASAVTQTLSPVKSHEIEESECFLTSVNNLRKMLEQQKHNLLTEIIQKHIFVGIVDLHRPLSLIQHSTKLYLINHAALGEELFYQLGARQFGNFHRIKLEPPPPVRHLVKLAVQAEDGRWKQCGLKLEEDEVVERIVRKITTHREMLSEYFSMKINEKDELESVPLLLRDYTPNLDKLPLFLMRLGPQVNWTEEQECFSSFLRELAYFYSPTPLLGMKDQKNNEKAERWQIQHILFPCMKKYLFAPKSLLDKDVVQVANLPDLYKVFERC